MDGAIAFVGVMLFSLNVFGDLMEIELGAHWTREYIEENYFPLSQSSEFLNFLSEESLSTVIYRAKDRVSNERIQTAVNRCSQYSTTWEKIACITVEANKIGYETDKIDNLCRYMANAFKQVLGAMKLPNVFAGKKSFFSTSQFGGRRHVVINLIVVDERGGIFSYAVDPDWIVQTGEDAYRIKIHPLSIVTRQFHSIHPKQLPKLTDGP